MKGKPPATPASKKTVPPVTTAPPAAPPIAPSGNVFTPVADGPPQPALQSVGFNGGINLFNSRVQAATDAHVQARGTTPSPGLTIDLARSPVDVNQFAALLSAPQSKMQARAAAAANANGGSPDLLTSPEELLAGARKAQDAGTYNVFAHQHYAALSEISKEPKYAAKLAGILSPTTALNQPQAETFGSTDEVKLAALHAKEIGNVFSLIGKAVGQVAEGLVHAPGGAIDAVDALGKDFADFGKGIAGGAGLPGSQANPDAFTFPRTSAIAKGMLKQTVNDYTHWQQRPGFVILDTLGFIDPAARGFTRISAAAKAEGLSAKASALVTRPRGGTVEIGPAGATEHSIVSDSPIVGGLSKLVTNRRQKAFDDTRINGEKVPAGLAGTTAVQGVTKFLDQHFSLATKVGREADARRRVDHTVAMTVARELDHAIGGSTVVAKAFTKMPAKVRIGLTRGENKAIQVLSFGTTPEDQIAFHQQMIDAKIGIEKSHRRQIADLHLAKKVLNNPNPSPRFRRAFALTQQVVSDAQDIKINELGLSAVQAENRLSGPATVFANPDHAIAQGEVDKLRVAVAKDRDRASTKGVDPVLTAKLRAAEEHLASLPAKVRGDTTGKVYPATGEEPVEPFYTKLEPVGKSKRPPSELPGYFATKAGPYGIPLPREMPELTHEFTGKSISAGDFRIDASALTSDGYGRTVRAATVLNEHARLWKAATEVAKTRFDVPIRDSQTIPDELRAALQDLTDGGISPDEAADLPADMQALIKELYPDKEQHLRNPIPGVKWVDERMMGAANDLPVRPGAVKQVWNAAVQEPLRDLTLFLRPAYALNLLGNGAMLAFDQGFAAVPSVARAISWKDQLGEDTVRTLDALGGSSRSKSYATDFGPKLGQKAASGWNIVTDRVFRRAAILYYLRKLGYDTPEKVTELVKTGGPDLVEAARRGNKSLVEFDNLTPFEKNTLRNIIFVYPWVSRSTVWSLRAVMEHPLKTDLLAQLGNEEADSDPLFQKVPYWFKHTGYIPVGWAKGLPLVDNLSSINTFSTLGSIYDLVAGGAGGNKGAARYNALDSLLGPAGALAEHEVTGRDEFGNPYPDHQWERAALEVLTQLPQVAAFERGGKENPPLKPFVITSRQSLVTRMNSAIHQTVFTPGWLDGYGALIAGGLSDRGANKQALEARYWKDATPEQQHAHTVTLLLKALGLQADFLKTKPYPGVRTAVRTAADLTQMHQMFFKSHGREMNSREKTDAAIEYLGAKGAITPAEESKLKKDIPQTNDNGEIDLYLKHNVLGKAGGYDAMRQWDSDVRNLYSFRKEVFNLKTKGLHAQGLVDQPKYQASQADIYGYGRQYLEYNKQKAALKQRVADGKATTADLRVFQDEHSAPVPTRPKLLMVSGNIPGLISGGNIDINNRKVAHNPDGSISTVRTISIGTDQGETLIPTVINGKVVSDDAAIAYYKRTGENLGTFKSIAAANAYSIRLHDEQAKVYLGGGSSTLPSFAAMDWANTSPQSQQTQLHGLADASWQSLSGFEKQLLGVKTAPSVSAGWKDYDESLAAYRAQNPGAHLAPNQIEYLVNAEDKQHPGFARDYEFAQKPKIDRFEATKLYTGMPAAARKAWDSEIGASAKTAAAAMKSGDYSTAELRQAWKNYVAQDVPAYLDAHPALKAYLAQFNRSFLSTLEEK